MRLSIVTVSFNAEDCIEKTIQSVLKQTIPVYEYIMIDGASKDHTYDIICSYDEEFEKQGIRFIHISEPDKGISDAFNKGIDRVTGDLVGIINADDELLPKTNQILSEVYETYLSDIYHGNCIWVDEKNHREYVSKPKSLDLSKLLYSMILIHPSTFVKKEIYDRFGTFDISYKYCMDKELLYRFYRNGVKFYYLNESLTKFKAGGVSDKNAKLVFKEGSKMALSYGEPKIKVILVEYKKTIKTILVRLLKQSPLYVPLKNFMNR